MKRVDNQIRGDDLRAAADAATGILQSVIGPAADQVEARWTETLDARNRQILTLRISDFTADATTQIAPDELSNPARLRERFYVLWGDLLQMQSARMVRNLRDAVGAQS